MLETLLIGQIQETTLVMLVVLARVLPCITLLPMFSLKLMTGLLRLGIAFAFSLFIFPLASQEQISLSALSPVVLGLLMVKEAFFGFLLGAMLAVPFWVVTAVGELFDSGRGALSGQQLNPMLGIDSSVTDDLLQKATIVLWVELGGIFWLVQFICNSYKLWHISDWWPRVGAGAWQNYLDIIRTAFDALIHYAAPLMIVLILAEMMLAIMSVHSPRLQPYYLAMPIKTMLGLLVLILYQPHLWHVLGEWFRHWYGGGWLVL